MDVRILPFKDNKDYGEKEKKLGEGTYGVVYKTTKNFAIKSIRLEDEGIPPTELREIVLLKNMNHPNIVPIIDVIFPENKLGIVLELGDGTLDNLLMATTKNIIQAKFLSFELANGIACMAAKDIIHRDLKPSNILFKKCEKYTRLWITDFGLARVGKCSDYTFSKEVYTIWYRPPEILLGGKYDHSADIWAFGCILAEIYLGKPLFPGDGELDMLMKIFKLLGVPTESDWKGVENLPNWSKDFSRLPFKRSDSLLSKIFDEKDLLDLVSKCLILDPSKRISIIEILKHPFYANILGNFESFNRTSCFYEPEPEVLSCTSRYQEIMVYPELSRFKSDDKINYIEKNRIILVEWLFDVAKSYKIDKKVLGLVVYMLDEYISRYENYKLGKLQAIGLTIFYIVCKFTGQDIYISDLAHISSGEASREDIVEMEKNILKELNFDLLVSTVADFLSLYDSFYSEKVRNLYWALYKYSMLTPLCFEYNAQDIALGLLFIAVSVKASTFKHSPYLSEEVYQVPRRFFKLINRIKVSDIDERFLKDIQIHYKYSSIKVL